MAQTEEVDGCLVWRGALNPKGYGLFYVDNRNALAHRYAYENTNGSVPTGLELDHLCRVRACVNVDHLEAVTHAENMARGAHAMKTHCKYGHPYDEVNTYRRPNDGGRDCRICIARRLREHAARKRAS